MADVRVETIGSLARLRLDRPKALNALTYAMIGEIEAALDRFEADEGVAALLLTGEGERGLCAGGDVRALYDSPDTTFPEAFWREEYRLDARIAAFEKPFVAVMDGIVLGGGVGLSAHARHRIATERSRIALPETGIGNLPDIGATWLLPRAPGEVGTYLGLTGEPMGAADAIFAGFADLMVPTDRLPTLIETLSALPAGAGQEASHAAVRAAIGRLAQDPGPAPLAARQAEIDRCFRFDTIGEILSALDTEGSDFAARTKASLLTKSPTSLVLTLSLLRLGRDAPSLEACLEREFHACLGILVEGDLREGIRAAVIDKDRNPRWSPARIEEVDPARIERWLEPRARPVFEDGPRR